MKKRTEKQKLGYTAEMAEQLAELCKPRWPIVAASFVFAAALARDAVASLKG